jgi:hypothetical protein
MNKTKDNAGPAKARKKPVTAASRAKMSRRRKEWWAQRKAMQAQPQDVMARIVYKSINLPYPYDDPELASSKIAKTGSTRRRSSKRGTVRPSTLAKIVCKVAGLPDPYDDPEPTPEGAAKVKPISTIAPPADLDE